MQITTETFGDVLVAHTPDDLTSDTSGEFVDALEPAIVAGRRRVVLQMERTDEYDSVGLTALLDLQDRLRGEGGKVVVCGLVDPGRKIFEVTRMDRKFEVFNSVVDAVSSFR